MQECIIILTQSNLHRDTRPNEPQSYLPTRKPPAACRYARADLTMSRFTRGVLLSLALASIAVAFTARTGAAAAAPKSTASPDYYLVDPIPMRDVWWNYALIRYIAGCSARANRVFKLDVDTGLMNPRVVPGSEGRAVTVLPGGDQVLTTVARYSAAILFAAQDGAVSEMFKPARRGTP